MGSKVLTNNRKQNMTTTLTPGQRGTYSGFPATIIRHYSGNMYEIRLPGGLICTDASYFVPN
jgi:hypothetical protein